MHLADRMRENVECTDGALCSTQSIMYHKVYCVDRNLSSVTSHSSRATSVADSASVVPACGAPNHELTADRTLFDVTPRYFEVCTWIQRRTCARTHMIKCLLQFTSLCRASERVEAQFYIGHAQLSGERVTAQRVCLRARRTDTAHPATMPAISTCSIDAHTR
jgi:hypothetical protein